MESILNNHLKLNHLAAGESELFQDNERHIKTLPFLSVVHAIEGEYEISIDGSRPAFTGEGGSFIAKADVLQNIVHHVPSGNSPMKACWVFIDIRLDGVIDLFKFIDIPLIISPALSKPFSTLIQEVLSLQQRPDSLLKQAALHRIAFALLEHIFRCSSIKKEFSIEADKFKRILPALMLIDSVENNNLTVSDLAGSVNLSEPRFHVIFKEATGKSPIAYLRDRRLTQASLLLLTGEQSLSEIASATGFYDQFHFCKAFTAKYGQSPLKYKKSYIEQHHQIR